MVEKFYDFVVICAKFAEPHKVCFLHNLLTYHYLMLFKMAHVAILGNVNILIFN